MSEFINPLKFVRGTFYGWWLVGLAALVMALGTVPLFQGMTAWFPVLETRFAWSRTQLALAFSFSRVEGSVMGPISGYLIEKLGPRRMVLIGLLVLGGGFILFSLIHELWQFNLAFIVISMGAGLGTWLPMMTVLNSWFIQRRSMAMAIAMDGFYVGGVLLVPLLAWAINPEEFGPDRWRLAAAAIGIIV
ncbi:MAG: MFS transporter, partial [Dehalococcoidia bacterium]|nr:MFS transporter [Dehalococcoidia bacterium]